MKGLSPEQKALGRAVEAYIASSKAKLSEMERVDFKLYIGYLISEELPGVFKEFRSNFNTEYVEYLESTYKQYVVDDGILITEIITYFNLELNIRKLRKRGKYLYE